MRQISLTKFTLRSAFRSCAMEGHDIAGNMVLNS